MPPLDIRISPNKTIGRQGKSVIGKPMEFLTNASKSNAEECIEWAYALTHKGYGYVRHNGKTKHAHRLVKQLEAGIEQKDKSMLAMHSCNNRKCVNPKHISFGTAKENSLHMVTSGNSTRGRGNKITREDVLDIRTFHEHGISNTAMAMVYPMSVSGISSIVTGRNWSWI